MLRKYCILSGLWLLAVAGWAQPSAVHLSLLSLEGVVPDTVLSGNVYGFSFMVKNEGMQAIETGNQVAVMLSVNHDNAQTVGLPINVQEIWYPGQIRQLHIPAYQFDAARVGGGGPNTDIIVWPTVMSLPNQVKDSIVKNIYFVNTAAFRVENSFVSGINQSINLNTTYSIRINAQNTGDNVSKGTIEFFLQVDNRPQVVLGEMNKQIAVGEMDGIFVQSFNVGQLDPAFVFDGSQPHLVTIGAREVGQTNAVKTAVYGLNMGTFPVELNHFAGFAQPEQNRIELNWSTLSETGNRVFHLEKWSDSDGQFKLLGELNGREHSNTIVQYQFWDDAPNWGKNTYRLTQLDMDGTEKVLETVQVDYRLGQPFALLNVAPIPVSDRLLFEFFNNQQEEIKVEIFDLSGRLMFSEKTVKTAGKVGMEVRVEDWAPGVYVYKLNSLYQIEYGRFMKN